MEKAPRLTIPSRNNIDEAFIQTSYTIATDYLWECYRYIVAAGDAVVCDFTVGTWSFKTKHSEVLKKGTNADKSKLPAMMAKNNPQLNKHTFSGGHARKAVWKRAKKGGKKRDVLDVTDEFEDAFGRASVGGDGDNRKWSKDLSVHDCLLWCFIYLKRWLCVAFDVLAKFVWWKSSKLTYRVHRSTWLWRRPDERQDASHGNVRGSPSVLIPCGTASNTMASAVGCLVLGDAD